jgi:hypothetical protein
LKIFSWHSSHSAQKRDKVISEQPVVIALHSVEPVIEPLDGYVSFSSFKCRKITKKAQILYKPTNPGKYTMILR